MVIMPTLWTTGKSNMKINFKMLANLETLDILNE